MGIPDAVSWKVFRSGVHLKEFQDEVEQYFKSNPGKVVREDCGDPNLYVGRFQSSAPIPGRLPIIVGDCLQNLRSALDYLVWELVLVSKNEPSRRTMFPICSTRKAFASQVAKGRLGGVEPRAFEEIEQLQPYHCGEAFGKAMLWILDDLCNINKHRRMLMTDLCGGASNRELRAIDGVLFARVDFGTIRKDATIGPFSIVNGPQGPGIRIDVDPKIVAYLGFNEGAVQNMDVGFVVVNLLKFVRSTVLPRFERFFP